MPGLCLLARWHWSHIHGLVSWLSASACWCVTTLNRFVPGGEAAGGEGGGPAEPPEECVLACPPDRVCPTGAAESVMDPADRGGPAAV
mmetsp:Transcript_95932/g.298727  ORF Transcript_95932/g.298727 Transcript_95932/m.298727 type:complete len:88 (-) Transcript_95932:51-314(-)